MITIIQILSSAMRRLTSEHVFILIVLACLTIPQIARAQDTNTYYGYSAGQSNGGQYDSAFGFQALAFFVTGDQNTAVGSGALSGSFDSNAQPISSGNDNTAIGGQALHSDRAGSYNTAIGTYALA